MPLHFIDASIRGARIRSRSQDSGMYQGMHQFLLEFPLNELERPDVLATLPIRPRTALAK